MSVQYTAGPWHFVPIAQMADCNEEGPMAGVFSDDDGEMGSLIATVEKDADARLMAASPDLLVALTRLVRAFENGASSSDADTVGSAWKAIATAMGVVKS